MFCTSDLQESVSDAERDLWGGEVSHVQADPPRVLLLTTLRVGLMLRHRDVGYKQRSGCVPWPEAGCQTPLEPIHIPPLRVPRLQERRQANILIEKPARLPPFSQGVPGGTPAILSTWQLCFGLFTHASNKKMRQKKKLVRGRKMATLFSGLLGLTEISAIKISWMSERTNKKRKDWLKLRLVRRRNLQGTLYSAPACFSTY